MKESLVFREVEPGVLRAPRTCGLLTVPDLIGHVRRWCATATTADLVVDLREVVDVEPAAVRAIVWARRYCHEQGVDLAVVPPARGVLPTEHELLLRMLVPRARPAPPDAAAGDGLVSA